MKHFKVEYRASRRASRQCAWDMIVLQELYPELCTLDMAQRDPLRGFLIGCFDTPIPIGLLPRGNIRADPLLLPLAGRLTRDMKAGIYVATGERPVSCVRRVYNNNQLYSSTIDWATSQNTTYGHVIYQVNGEERFGIVHYLVLCEQDRFGAVVEHFHTVGNIVDPLPVPANQTLRELRIAGYLNCNQFWAEVERADFNFIQVSQLLCHAAFIPIVDEHQNCTRMYASSYYSSHHRS